ncbi:MAG TPA: polysaccharide deacetylase family protein [Candidatus Scatomorpha merdigallinarum]|nr:polysaccharide deacetylase family protein [Candidatus Scatomorpha merdigallinarum]
MKRALCVALILLLALLPGAVLAADSSVCFVAVNDDLLPLTSQAYTQGGQYYVPSSVFTQLRLYSTYHSGSSTLEMTSTSRQMYFNVATGETYDSDNNYYTSSAILRGSTVYVPVDFVCRQFGLSWSYIRGDGYGDVCRITDGSASLSNSLFMSAARPLMESRYNEYTGSTPSPGTDGGDVTEGNSVVFLSFQGLPSTDILTILDTYGVKATFFLTAQEIESNPNIVRRIVGEGHNVGALCSSNPAGEYAAFSESLWTVAHTVSVLVGSSSRDYDEACSNWANSNDMAFCDYNIDGVRSGDGVTAAQITSMLSAGRPWLIYVRLQCSLTTQSNLADIIGVLRSDCMILAACETGE